MPRVGFVPTNPVFEQGNTVYALDRADTVIGPPTDLLSRKQIEATFCIFAFYDFTSNSGLCLWLTEPFRACILANRVRGCNLCLWLTESFRACILASRVCSCKMCLWLSDSFLACILASRVCSCNLCLWLTESFHAFIHASWVRG
jgi:hypothetical protein